jgi:hypothetical protein
MKKTGLLFVLLLFLSSLVWPSAIRAALDRPDCELSDLWFGLRINPGLVDWFNQVARPDDVAAVTAQQVEWLDQVTAGRKQVLFASVAEAEAMVPSLAGKIDIIGYDLEHWPATPAEEQADPVAAVQRLQTLARQYDLIVMLGPDRRFALTHGAEMAPYADRFSLQLQRMQNDPDALRAFALPLIHDLRQANPALEISAQFRTEGSMEQLRALVASLQDEIDGVSIIYNSQTVASAQELVRLLRTSESGTPPSPTSTETVTPSPSPSSTPEIGPAPETTMPPTPPLPTARATSTPPPPTSGATFTLPPPTVDVTSTPPPDSDAPLSRDTLVAGGLVVLFIVIGIVIVIVLLHRRKRTDKAA